MDAHDVLKSTIGMGRMIATSYLDDLTDEEMMHRPDPKCNHINWQLGHLIASEHQMINGVCPGAMPALPDGFAEKYTKETAGSDDANAFEDKESLMKTYEEQRAATLAALDGISNDDLGNESPEQMRAYAPTVAAVFELQGSHYLMHAGQWAVIRRQLGRPPMF